MEYEFKCNHTNGKWAKYYLTGLEGWKPGPKDFDISCGDDEAKIREKGGRTVWTVKTGYIPEKETTVNINDRKVTDVQVDIMEYLTEPGHPERKKALLDLTNKDLFGASISTVGQARWFTTILETYLKENPQGFCADGIRRFREAIGLHSPKKVHTATFTVEVEFEGDETSTVPPDFGVTSSVGNRLLKAAKNGLLGHEVFVGSTDLKPITEVRLVGDRGKFGQKS